MPHSSVHASLKKTIIVVPVAAVLMPSIVFLNATRRSITIRGLLVLALVAGVASSTSSATSESPSTPATSSPSSQPANPSPTEPQASQPSNSKVSVLCVDAQGKPVSDAEVFLFQHPAGDKSPYVQSGPFKSDEQGRAHCSDAIFSNESGNFDRWIYARVPSHLIGTARAAKWTNRAPFNAEGRVKLHPSRSIEGMVTVPAGYDPTKVIVRTRVLHVITGPNFFDYESFPREDSFPGLDTALPERFDCRPDKSGRIHFSDVPVSGRLTLITSGDGLAECNGETRARHSIRRSN